MTSRSIRSSPTTSSAPSSSCISSGTTNGRTTWRTDVAGSSRYANHNPPYSTASGRSGPCSRWMVTSLSTSETTAAATRVFQVAGRRVEYLRHPLTLMRAALAANATLSNVRTQGSERLVDLKLDAIQLTVGFDTSTKLPSRVVQLVYSETFGDRPNEMRWSDYRAVSGVQLPTLLTWKVGRWTVGQVRVVRQTIDGDVGNLAAPAAVVSAPRPAAPAPPQSAVREIAKGIWEHTGTTHKSFIVECSDHLVLVDAPNVERTLAVMARAKELRPNKPVTTLILGHNHGDHTGGIRTAVAMGVNEIVTHRSNLTLLDETFKNPHTLNPDLYSKTPNAKPPKITAIDDEGILKDAMNTINLYHLLDSSHSRTQLMIYYANARMLTLADVYMPNDPRVYIPGEPFGHAPWLQNVAANIQHRKLQIDTMAPVHGDVIPFSQFMEEAIFLTAKPPTAR